MHGMNLMRGFRPVARAYGLSIAVWCGLSLLTGLQYRIFDKELNIHTSLLDMLLHVTGEYGLRVKGGREYTVARTYKKNLKSLAEFWIGGGAFLAD